MDRAPRPPWFTGATRLSVNSAVARVPSEATSDITRMSANEIRVQCSGSREAFGIESGRNAHAIPATRTFGIHVMPDIAASGKRAAFCKNTA